MSDEPRTYRMKSGRVLNEADVEALAVEAERGYDIDRLSARPGRPLIGSAPAVVVPVRLHRDLHAAVKREAATQETSLSEFVREALRRCLADEPSTAAELRTASGRVLADAEIDRLAGEAEAGYEASLVRRRPKRRGLGRAGVVPVRMPPELKAEVERRAEVKSTSVSEVIRAALRASLGDSEIEPPARPTRRRTNGRLKQSDSSRDQRSSRSTLPTRGAPRHRKPVSTRRERLTSNAQSFQNIRSWDGSQHRAFEELAFQLREPAPQGAVEVKTGDPDAGLEWYVTLESGEQWGWQAKFIFDVASLLGAMRDSARAVASKRPAVTRLTFCIPIDLPEDIRPGQRKSARQRFDEAAQRWRRDIPGAANIEFCIESAGVLLDRLARADSRGRPGFWWGGEVFSSEWCRARLDEALVAVGPRYTPELHVELPIAFVLQGLARSDEFRRRYRRYRGDVVRTAADLAHRDRVPEQLGSAYAQVRQAEASWRVAAHARDYGPGDEVPYASLRASTQESIDAAYAFVSAARDLYDAERLQRDESQSLSRHQV